MTDYDDPPDPDWDMEDPWDEEDDGDPCIHCGPWCHDWGGDGICISAVEAQADVQDQYETSHVHENITCPVCGAVLIMYDVETDKLWTWPGDVNPLLGLFVYSAYSVPKGVVHQTADLKLAHIWIGEGDMRHEKLIRLTGRREVEYDRC